MTDQPLKLLLDYDEAAAALSMTRAALRDLVYKGRGPVVTRIGTRTFFAIEDLQAFVQEHRQTGDPPAERAAAASPKRRRGRPTIADQMARNAAFQT